MADAWRHESLTLETLRDVYANLNHSAEPPAAAREEARRRAERAVAGAVFELGLRQCSPKVIKGLLAVGPAAGSPALADLTTEHIKAHLQKYRQKIGRSRQPFLDHFERYLRAPAARALAPAPSSGRATRRTCWASVPRARDALDAAVGRAPGVLSELAAERARLRRDVDAALAEHRRLADELAKLAPSPPPVLR